MDNYQIGDTASFTKTFTLKDVQAFAELAGDDNPLHLDEEFAAKGPFGKPIVHGALTSALISTVLGTKLPGPGAIFVSQELSFVRPVFLEDAVTATVTVSELNTKKNRLIFSTECRSQHDKVVIRGDGDDSAELIFLR